MKIFSFDTFLFSSSSRKSHKDIKYCVCVLVYLYSLINKQPIYTIVIFMKLLDIFSYNIVDMGEKLLNLYFFYNIYAEFQISLDVTRIHQSHIKTNAGLHKNYDLVNNIMVRHV